MDDYYFKEAQICLNCKKPVCTNCLEAGGGIRSSFKPLWDERKVRYIIKGYNSGMTAKAIATQLHMNSGTLAQQLNKLGFKFAGERPTMTLELLEERQNEYLLSYPHAQRII